MAAGQPDRDGAEAHDVGHVERSERRDHVRRIPLLQGRDDGRGVGILVEPKRQARLECAPGQLQQVRVDVAARAWCDLERSRRRQHDPTHDPQRQARTGVVEHDGDVVADAGAVPADGLRPQRHLLVGEGEPAVEEHRLEGSSHRHEGQEHQVVVIDLGRRLGHARDGRDIGQLAQVVGEARGVLGPERVADDGVPHHADASGLVHQPAQAGDEDDRRDARRHGGQGGGDGGPRGHRAA